MKKIDQTITKGEGNAIQAVIASLLELDLKQVPDFMKHNNNEDPYLEMYYFLEKHGYDMNIIDVKIGDKPVSALDITEIDGGVNGFFMAEVPHQTTPKLKQAVIVDKNLNIVHDPNPDKLALNLTPNDIIHFYTVKDNWYFDLDGLLKKDN